MTYPMRISPCTSTIETAVYVNRTHGGVRGRELVTPSYSIVKNLLDLVIEWYFGGAKWHLKIN